MSSSSSLSSARRRRVGSQNTVQNPPASVRDATTARLQRTANMQQQNMQQQNMQQQQNAQQQNMRQSNIASSMQIPANESMGQRQSVNPAQLLLQHDYRLFQIEKLVKSMHDNISNDEGKTTMASGDNQEINMEEIKVAVSNSMYESERLKE